MGYHLLELKIHEYCFNAHRQKPPDSESGEFAQFQPNYSEAYFQKTTGEQNHNRILNLIVNSQQSDIVIPDNQGKYAQAQKPQAPVRLPDILRPEYAHNDTCANEQNSAHGQGNQK
jgi:hypothetical protein